MGEKISEQKMMKICGVVACVCVEDVLLCAACAVIVVGCAFPALFRAKNPSARVGVRARRRLLKILAAT